MWKRFSLYQFKEYVVHIFVSTHPISKRMFCLDIQDILRTHPMFYVLLQVVVRNSRRAQTIHRDNLRVLYSKVLRTSVESQIDIFRHIICLVISTRVKARPHITRIVLVYKRSYPTSKTIFQRHLKKYFKKR